MYKIIDVSPVVGTRIELPKSFHKKILNFCKIKSFPHRFVIRQDFANKCSTEHYYICESIRDPSKRIALTEYVIKYLLAEETPDSNVGLHFCEYLPSEDTQILITNVRNLCEVIAVTFKVQPKLISINKRSIICVDFMMDLINGSGEASIRYYMNSYMGCTWKFLKNPDTSFMSDYEKIFQDTLIHKEFVLKSTEKLARYLDSIGATHHAQLLRQRAIVHDNSKINNRSELIALSKIINDKSTLRDSSVPISSIMRDAIQLHWQNNSHHPEHYKNVVDMSKIDIMEMCCDWHARSMQYNSDFLSFVKKRQEERFHFPDWMFAEIWHYCEVLNDNGSSPE